MKNITKGLSVVETELSPADIEKIELAAMMHGRHSNITFKFVSLDSNSVTIKVIQGKSAAGNYQNKKRLIEIVHETFDSFFPGKKIHVQPVPYEESPVDKVNAEWIQKKMLDSGTRLKDIAKETGIEQTQLSAAINGGRPLSQVTKAMFYFYLMNKVGKS